ncbi:RNA-binding domain-containing protein [Haemophilus haemolyticus]|uniref:RNA-binding domain-containing protein n=1 Tax=Haemophilus haemolyticus TaxID=726 RepID=UPI000E588CB9|nr:RNA-binding domain-containing protein [Haemophilus haemolyticus]
MLPINIESLLTHKTIESNRIEFKSGWNPDSIYRSICAFANDIEDIGGGYIFIGVEEENGIAKRPVKGLDDSDIDRIQREMLGFNHLITPNYFPKTYVEELDGKKVIILWVISGSNRPYQVPQSITSRQKQYEYYIRYNTSSIIANSEQEQELKELANKIPFDDRINRQANINDISLLRINDFLVKTESKLASYVLETDKISLLKQLDLVENIGGVYYPKNIALMMFCDNPDQFFPQTQVDITIFPEGKINNPDYFVEIPSIKGPIDSIINDTLRYLRNNLIKEFILKPKEQAESIRLFNYPYQALEEAVVNALYHRNYQERQPVEIIIQPNSLEIISYNGPDKSIQKADLIAGNVRARRYKNRRLGDFLKELKLSEGKGTGLPTIKNELRKNGSEPAKFEFDEDRTFFLIEFTAKNEHIKSNLPLCTETEQKIIEFLLTGEKSRKDILALLNKANSTYSYQKFIEPLVLKNWIEKTEKSNNNPKQRFRLTDFFYRNYEVTQK